RRYTEFKSADMRGNSAGLAPREKIEIALLGEEVVAGCAHQGTKGLLRQPMHERQDGVEFDRKPAVRRRQEHPLARNAAAFLHVGVLFLLRTDMLNHRR